MRLRWPIVAVAVSSVFLMGVDACFYPIPGVVPVDVIDDPDTRCGTLTSMHPPDVDFDPVSGLAWVVDPTPARLVPFVVDEVPPVLNGTVDLPFGSQPQAMSFLEPIPIDALPDSLALVTGVNRDVVRLLDAVTPTLVTLLVRVQASLLDPTYPQLPPPGASSDPRLELSTEACVSPDPELLDSRGDEITGGAECAGYRTSSTSGAAVAGTSLVPDLFVAMANRGAGAGTENPQYFPGTVLVYDVDLSAGVTVFPHVTTPVIYTSGFNPTQIVPYAVGGREFLLVTVSGALGTVQDDPMTSVVEGGSISLTESSIDVIDASTRQLVATIPLGDAGLVGNLAIHPGGRLAVVGSRLDRWVFAIDLEPLADPDLPLTTPMGGPVVLDGSAPDLESAVIRDASNPYVIPARSDGANPTTCPGLTIGLAFNDAGSMLYATDFCDGTLTAIGVSPMAGGPPTLTGNAESLVLTAPSDSTGTAPRGLGSVAVRPGVPGVAFTGPDVFVLVGEPTGLLCAVAIESGS